jgi:hypothetical protein
VFVIEYQKRGLPHSHILFWISNFDHHNPRVIDDFVCAKLPDPDEDPMLFELVTSYMMHGPCGDLHPNAVCMVEKNGRKVCSKSFPKPFTNETIPPDNAYPIYQRRQGFSHTVKQPLYRDQDIQIGNEWVVPFNPFLLRKYRAHINVEVCAGMFAVKYLHKYLHKGPDRATAELTLNKAKDLISGRYIGSSGTKPL